MVALRGAKRRPQLLLYMRDAVRAHWYAKEAENGSRSRTQQYAPPETLPGDAVSVFTDGSAVYDKTAKAWVEAGSGFVAVTGGQTSEHIGGVDLHHFCRPVVLGDDGAQQYTNNVAEMAAFIHALRWVRLSPLAKGKPICIRYDSKYAALVGCGAWKAKANKAIASVARAEWDLAARATRATGGQLWLRHVKGHSDHTWNDVADRLADQGRQGRKYAGPPYVD